MNRSIAIFSSFFPPHLGGVEYYSYGLAEFFSNEGFDVYVITTTKNYIKTDKYKILALDSAFAINDRLPVIMLTKNNLEVFRKLKNVNLYGAIIQTRLYPLSLIAVSFLYRYSIPCLLIEHGTGHFSFSNAFINRIGEWYEHATTSYIKKRCSNFYGVSQGCYKWLAHFGINPKGIFNNSINIREFTANKDEKKSDNVINIAFAGRLIPEKGVEKLIQAFANVKKIKPNIYLYIAGSGELYDKYKNKIINGVTFMGNISHQKVIELLKKSDIYCFPSDYPEGLPTTVLEAAAAKTMIIASDVGGIKEFICNEDCGVILKNNSVPKIEEALVKYIESDQERKRLSDNAYKRVIDSFTWEVTGKKILIELELFRG